MMLPAKRVSRNTEHHGVSPRQHAEHLDPELGRKNRQSAPPRRPPLLGAAELLEPGCDQQNRVNRLL